MGACVYVRVCVHVFVRMGICLCERCGAGILCVCHSCLAASECECKSDVEDVDQTEANTLGKNHIAENFHVSAQLPLLVQYM